MHEPLLLKLTPTDNQKLAQLCGALDENLRQIEQALSGKIARRGERFSIRGTYAASRQARDALQKFYAECLHNDDALSLENIQLGLIELTRSPASGMQAGFQAQQPRLMTQKSEFRGRTPRQVEYLQRIYDYDITFGMGPAGTGKTYLAVASAVDAFEREQVERIILTRPAVEAGERLGFLPGDLSQKVDPYLRPLYDALYELMGFEKVSKLLERGNIEIAPLAFMRGRTLNRAFIILDEAQNTTPEQMKMFLTRIGIGAKAVINGDLTQIDLAKGVHSGLRQASDILRQVQGIAFVEFGKEDVVRHPLVARIVEAYEDRQRNF